MSTALNLPLHVMPADAARIDSAQAAGTRLIAAGTTVWQFLSAIGEARGRESLSELARDMASTRPELAASLQRAARRNWS